VWREATAVVAPPFKITLVACVVQCARVCACVLCCCRPFPFPPSPFTSPVTSVVVHALPLGSLPVPVAAASSQLLARPPLLPPHPHHQAPLFSRRSYCSTRLRASYFFARFVAFLAGCAGLPYIARMCWGWKSPSAPRPRSFLPRAQWLPPAIPSRARTGTGDWGRRGPSSMLTRTVARTVAGPASACSMNSAPAAAARSAVLLVRATVADRSMCVV
jgi:hypothetical protein